MRSAHEREKFKEVFRWVIQTKQLKKNERGRKTDGKQTEEKPTDVKNPGGRPSATGENKGLRYYFSTLGYGSLIRITPLCADNL